MARLIFLKNPLRPFEREEFELAPGARPIEWLLEHYPPPHGCGAPVSHWHNGERVAGPTYDRRTGAELTAGEPDYLTRPVEAGDQVILAVSPLGTGFGEALLIAAIVAVVSAAVSIGLALIFKKPESPDAAAQDGPGTASPVYNVRSRQNTARLGEPIPVVYGEVLTTPDLCAQPYRVFDGNRGAHMDVLMCLGHGEFDVHEIQVGDSEFAQIEGAAARYIIVPPSRHAGQFGQLHSVALENGWNPGFYENMVTSAEVSEQRFTEAGDSAGYYRIGRAGVTFGRFILLNVEWPRGLFQIMEDGSVTGTYCDFDVDVYEANEDGNAIGGNISFHISENRTTIDPVRMTYVFDCGRSGAWLVRMTRQTARYPNGEEMNEYYWRALMLTCGSTQAEAYGAVTLLMVRLVAEQVASSAERLIRVRMTRRLPVLGSGEAIGTTSPADAFADVLCNATYGARRPLAELDAARLAELRDYWGGYQFNAVYTQRTTVWEALAQTVQGVAAAPLPIGALMSVAQDGPRPVRSMLFTEQNIVRGAFSLTYQFEQTGQADGVEVEYVDPLMWSPAYVRYPELSSAPERVSLFGCSDATHAAQFARLSWQRRRRLRRLVEFDTEMEGLIPLPAERIGLAHTLPRWGVSGYVAGVEPGGLVVLLDRELPWADVPGPWFMLFRDEYSGASDMVGATPHANGPRWATLAADPWNGSGGWRLGLRQEGTHWAWGDGERVVKDFTLSIIAPKARKVVSLTGVVYDPAVYDSTLDFFSNPVP